MAHTLAMVPPQLTPKTFDLAALTTDWNDAHNLLGVENKAWQLFELIVRTSEWPSGMDLKSTPISRPPKRNTPDARAVYEQLKAVYPEEPETLVRRGRPDLKMC
jgi:hypothetical protein